MPPRPRLTDGVGRAKTGRPRELERAPVDLVAFDLPIELGGPGRLAWLQFSASPMPWWHEADLPVIAQYCAALDALERARSGSAAGWAAVCKESRALADSLGSTPMSRARMDIHKRPSGGSGGLVGADGVERAPAPVIPLGELFADDAQDSASGGRPAETRRVRPAK